MLSNNEVNLQYRWSREVLNTIKIDDCVCKAIANGTGMDYKKSL